MIELRSYTNPDYPCSRCKHDGDTKICGECGVTCTPTGRVKKPSKWEAKYGRKIYDCQSIPKSLSNVVYAIVQDYGRREYEIAKNELPATILDGYRLYNKAIDYCLDFMEDNLQAIMMGDICKNRGFYCSDARFAGYSHNAYFRRKRKFIYDVAHTLSLI